MASITQELPNMHNSEKAKGMRKPKCAIKKIHLNVKPVLDVTLPPPPGTVRTCFVPVAALCKSDSWRIFQTKKEELETELWEHLFLAIMLKNGHFALQRTKRGKSS